MLNMLVIGHRCKHYRKFVLKCTQEDVSRETGFSTSNISAFETGRNDSALIFLWYLSHGVKLEYVMGGEPIE